MTWERTVPPGYRGAVCCQTCEHAGQSILNGTFSCSKHERPVSGYAVCDDYHAGEAI